MSLNFASIDLTNGLKTARQAWEEARQRWNDAVGRDFEENRWFPLEEHTRTVLQALDRLGPVLDKAIRDCS